MMSVVITLTYTYYIYIFKDHDLHNYLTLHGPVGVSGSEREFECKKQFCLKNDKSRMSALT